MEEIKAPKKERKFLKAMGDIALTLFRELLLGVGKKVINKVGNKRQGLAIALVMVAGVSYASIDSIPYPITGNKQKLGWQTTGNGLVYRGTAADTVTKPSNYTNKDIKAYLLVDTVNNVMYSYIASKGGWKFNNSDTVIIQGVTMPFDSITFNTAKNGTVGVGEVEYNDTQGSLIQGLKGGNVTNVIGQQLHQRVNNRTGATLTKGTAVYLSGSQGNRITVDKALGVTDAFSANTFGIVAESIANNQSGYVITEGLITNINTSSLVEDSAVYLSPTVAGGLTSTKPQAPQHNVYIGVCVKSNPGSGELFVSIKNGLEITELHDVRITSPVDKSSLYYKSSEKLWRDTTAALLTSDTASMLNTYFKKSDTTSLNLTSRFAAKLNISDTASMLTNYLRSGVAASTYQAKLNGTGFVKASGTTISYDNSTYLTTGTAASTYLPLTGGTLSGFLNAVDSISVNGISTQNARFTLNTNKTGISNRIFFVGNTGSGVNDGIIQLYENGILKVNIAANNARGGDTYFNGGGKVGIGTTTPSATFEVHGSAVFNEGSTDSDFRVESYGNPNMLFVHASTNRVGIGTNAPSKTLDINGEVKIATVTATPTALLGKDGSNVVGELGLGTGMSVGSGILSVQAAGASATGLVTSFGSQSFGGNKTFNGTVTFQDNGFFKKNIELPIVKINNADYTATTSNHTIIYTILTADKTLTIPNAADAVGMKYIISIFDIPEGNEALTLVTPSLNLFVRTDGENSSVDIVGGYCTTIQSDGTKWYILSYAPMY